jgi:hypothetical protein
MIRGRRDSSAGNSTATATARSAKVLQGLTIVRSLWSFHLEVNDAKE